MAIRFKSINWRLLILHFLSIPFLILGARQIVLIPYAETITLYKQGGMQAVADSSQGLPVEDTVGIMTHPLYAWFLTILVGCMLSALVVWHRRESKLLPVLLFVLAIVTSRTQYDKSEAVMNGLALLRWPLEAWPLAIQFGIVGSVLLIVGGLPFLLTWRRPVQELN